MLRSISNRSNNRNTHDVNTVNNDSAAHHRRTTSFLRTPELIKKIFNSSSGTRDENEMYEIIPRATSEQNIHTIQRSETSVSADDLLHQSDHDQSLDLHTTCSTTTTKRKCRLPRTISMFTNKIKASLHEHKNPDENEQEKNKGFLVVDHDCDSELVFHQIDHTDQHATQHAVEPTSIQLNDEHFDLNQIQYIPTTPLTSIFSPPHQPVLGASKILFDNLLEAQSTRSSVECGPLQADLLGIYDTQAASLSSTNSSSHEYTGVDRSLLDDLEYIRAQQLDLDLLTMLSVDFSSEHSYLESDLREIMGFNRSYEEALQENSKLKKELHILQEKYDHMYSPWPCELCTFDNKPYIETKCDTCQMCESPGPLKRATLTK